jgi:hypothetical protein
VRRENCAWVRVCGGPGLLALSGPGVAVTARVSGLAPLAGSFVPPEEIRRLRTHTRYRLKLVQVRTAQKERCGKLLEDAHLKLSSLPWLTGPDLELVMGRAVRNWIGWT